MPSTDTVLRHGRIQREGETEMAFLNAQRRKKMAAAEGAASALPKDLSFTAKEQYKMLRTNLNFVLSDDADRKCAIIGVTSSTRGEGKSTTSINLAYTLAEDGKRVLLIDADLRLPSLAKKIGCKNIHGLTDLLTNSNQQDPCIFKTDIHDNLYLMTSGAIPPNPSELLGSRKMEKILQMFSECFSYIIVDLPPVNIVTDALAISKYLTGMILVVRSDYTEKQELDSCVRQLRLSNVRILGSVMTRSKSGRSSYGKYKKQYYYKSYADSKPAKGEDV